MTIQERTPEEGTFELYQACMAFVEDQSCGEWGSDLVRGDARKLLHFVQIQIVAALTEANAELERAWRDGWAECRARLTENEVFCLTEDVEDDAWLDSATRAAFNSGQEGGA